MNMRAFFVPNEEYMLRMFGDAITGFNFDCYNDTASLCYWLHHLVFPVRDVFDNIVGFVGYNPLTKERHKEDQSSWSTPVYKHSNKMVFKKSNYLFAPPGMLERALRKKYIVITDGVFDSISANLVGLPAGSALGSYISEEMYAILSLFDTVVLSMDNDEAGLKMKKSIENRLNNVRVIKQSVGKDLDDLLKSKYRDDFLRKLSNNLSYNFQQDIIYPER